MTSMWIGPDETLTVGQVGFLIENWNEANGGGKFYMRDIPAHTNQSHQPRLHGWCGSWNNVATHGRGLVRVERVAKNGRAFVRELEGDELKAGLEDLGYPELYTE